MVLSHRFLFYMAKSRQAKEAAVARMSQQLKAGRGIVFADFTGLLVKELQELRVALRQAGVYYEVVKKTLLKRGLSDAGLTNISVDGLGGSVSVAVSREDEVAPAKTLIDFAKTHDKLKVFGGVLENNYVEADKIKFLAKLPSKPELLGQLVGSIKAPLTGLVNVLQGNLRGLVQVLKAVGDKKSLGS